MIPSMSTVKDQFEWRELDEPIELRLDKVLKLDGYVRVISDDPANIIIKRGQGTTFSGRPIHHWYFYLKGFKRSPRSRKVVFTHWDFEEDHPASRSPATLGFALFFPEVIEEFETPEDVARELLYDLLLRFERLSRAKKVETKFGKIWDIHIEEVKGWIRDGFPVIYYKCKNCGIEAFKTFKSEVCPHCGGEIGVVEIGIEDLP